MVEGKRVRSRLLSPREAARLMGLDDDYVLPERYNDAYHVCGDGVCVPVVRHIASTFLNLCSWRARRRACRCGVANGDRASAEEIGAPQEATPRRNRRLTRDTNEGVTKEASPPMTYDRSAVMRAVKSRDTGPERAVRVLLRAIAPGYRLHRADLPGKPDVVYAGRKLAIFVHGCFWHGHDCARGARMPKANAAYWRAKIARNRARDTKTLAAYPLMGWRAVVVYECELKDRAALSARLVAALRPEHGWRSRAPLGDN